MKRQVRQDWKSVLMVVLIMGVAAWSNASAGDQFAGVAESAAAVRTAFDEIGITFGGVIEVEAGYEDMDFDDPAQRDENASDLTLATVEFGMDARINPYVLTHVLLLYEQAPDAEIEVDEAFVQLGGDDALPFYAVFGRQYVPFGYFGSHFISDPLTLELGETQETAGVFGYANDWVDIFFGIFNGDINKTGEDNDHLENFVSGIMVTFPENALATAVLGASYISNIADSDALSDEIVTADQTVADNVPGYSVFASLAFSDRVFVEAEFLGAVDEFEAGELSFDSGKAFQPGALNVEFAVMVTDSVELGLRYGASNDAGDFLPESLFGGVVNYAIFENTSVALEILTGKFENDDTITICTGQLAVEF